MDFPNESPPHFDGRNDDVAALKIPPHSIEAEQSVLGGLMLVDKAWDRVADRIVESDFYRKDHQLIFRAIAALAERSDPRDVVTVSEWLDKTDLLEDAGRLDYLAMLAKETPSAANIEAYADIVRERAVFRQLIEVSEEIGGNAFSPEGKDAREVLDLAEQAIFRIAEQHAKGRDGFVDVRDLLTDVVETIQQIVERGDKVTGVPTGITDFDNMTMGLQPGDLVIVAGRPSMGKTSFAMNIAESAALRSGKSVGVFSMEMPAEQLIIRMLSSMGRIDQTRIRSGTLTDDDWPRITSTVKLMSQAKLFIDDSPGLSPTEVRARARRLKRDKGLDLVVVDYLQLMQVPGMNENRTAEISEISRGLKAVAKEMGVPVIALSQLNRNLEQRADKRPVMADLRESGAIEQDADLICFVYRDEVYNEDTADKGVAEIIIGKHRNGPTGAVRTAFIGPFTRFENLASEEYF